MKEKVKKYYEMRIILEGPIDKPLSETLTWYVGCDINPNKSLTYSATIQFDSEQEKIATDQAVLGVQAGMRTLLDGKD